MPHENMPVLLNKEINMEYDYIKTPEYRYRNDTQFHALVNAMYAHIAQGLFTPTEIRQAAIYASIMHERNTIREIFVPVIPEAIEKCLNALQTWEKNWLKSTHPDSQEAP